MRTLMLVTAAALGLAAFSSLEVAEARRGKTRKVLVQSTSGSNDPTQAVLALVGAWGIAEAGHEVQIVLAGEAAYLLDETVATSTVGVGLGSAQDWFGRLAKHEVKISVCGACGKARAVPQEAYDSRRARAITAKDFGHMVADADRVVSY